MEKMANSEDDIATTILNERDRFISFGVSNIAIFGSFVRGTQNPSSDIDILVEFSSNVILSII